MSVFWWTKASDLAVRGEASILVTVCTVQGSAPREAGAKMLVWKDGQDGTVGGGNLEFTIVEQARRMLHSPAPWRFQNYPLGPLLAQCCGGNVGILLERIDGRSLPWLWELANAEASLRPYSLTSQLGIDQIIKQVSQVAECTDGQAGIRVVPAASEDSITRHIGQGSTISERVAPRASLLMFGAGHVGKAVAQIASTLPFHLSWFDTRPEFATEGVELTDNPVSKIDAALPGSFFLIFTQNHSLDYELTRAVMRRANFRYCGLIGSATKRTRFEKRLVADGIPKQALATLTCPIGAIGLKSKIPAIIAVAVTAELLLSLQNAVQADSRTAKETHVG